jgi:hypothetical protein
LIVGEACVAPIRDAVAEHGETFSAFTNGVLAAHVTQQRGDGRGVHDRGRRRARRQAAPRAVEAGGKASPRGGHFGDGEVDEHVPAARAPGVSVSGRIASTSAAAGAPAA